MKTVEIRWKEVASDDELSDFNSYLKEMEDVDTPSAVEDGFSSWIKEHVEGRKIIISDMEIFVDGKYYPLERGNEADHFYRRLKEASGR
jgi:poly(A) polymerase Pap1